MAKRNSTKAKALDLAQSTGDQEAQARIFRWSPGGRMEHHKYLESARVAARRLGHRLPRFRPGKDEGECPEIYGTECMYCERNVVVARDEETREWRATGPAIDGRPCPGPPR
jgi:hypothetical protein